MDHCVCYSLTGMDCALRASIVDDWPFERVEQGSVTGDRSLEAVGHVGVRLRHGRTPGEVGDDLGGSLGEHVVDRLAAVEVDALLERRAGSGPSFVAG